MTWIRPLAFGSRASFAWVRRCTDKAREPETDFYLEASGLVLSNLTT